MIKAPKEFWDFAQESGIAAHIGYNGLDIFRAGAHRIEPSARKIVIEFLKSLISSTASNEEIRMLWGKSQTYMPGAAGDARQFTSKVIALVENPEPPAKPSGF